MLKVDVVIPICVYLVYVGTSTALAAPSTTVVTECDELAKKVFILDRATKDDIILSTYNRSVGVHVTITCALEEYNLNGKRHLTCLPSGKWSGATPICEAPGMPIKTSNSVIIGSTVGTVGLLTIIILVAVTLCVRRHKCKRPSFRSRVLHNASNHIQLQDGTYRRSYTNNDGETCFGNYNKGFTGNERRTYKVWTYQRKQRKHIQAENLQELIQKGKEIFSYSGKVKIVLCEDGTEIDDDDCLLSCADQTLMMLHEGEQWTPPRVIYVPWSTFKEAMTKYVDINGQVENKDSVPMELGTAQFMMCPLPEGFKVPHVDTTYWNAPSVTESSTDAEPDTHKF